MTKQELAKILEVLRNCFPEAKELPFLNCGGCVVFAKELKAVPQTMGAYKVSLVILDGDWGDDPRINTIYQKRLARHESISVPHCVVKVGDELFDSESILGDYLTSRTSIAISNKMVDAIFYKHFHEGNVFNYMFFGQVNKILTYSK